MLDLPPLITPQGAPFALTVTPERDGWRSVTAGGRTCRHRMPDHSQAAYMDWFDALALAFDLRRPLARSAPPAPRGEPALTPLLTKALSEKILYGYGDPCVVRVGQNDYRLLVTSNDAPDAFPILASQDLESWRLTGFVFPEGEAPAWTLTGLGRADFWAPELHRVGETWLLCFTARAKDRSLCIGLARAPTPDGPFEADPEPLLTGGVIDSHILVDADGQAWLVWKTDDNAIWPRRLNALLHRRPELTPELFEKPVDRRTAALSLTLQPWVEAVEPMQQFCLLQPLIETAAHDLPAFERRLHRIRDEAPDDVDLIAQALATRIYMQRLSADGRGLVGERTVILQNDQPWEAHLIEGVWITRAEGRYHLLYAGNDFSTAHYGVGLAVSEAPAGPYRKRAEMFLASSAHWWGPGHPSVAEAPDGRLHVFLHAFRPGDAGYKAFRAFLAAPLTIEGGELRLES